jgi:hypothetical protein
MSFVQSLPSILVKMRDVWSKYGAIVAAVVLSFLTLGVFAMARDKGPESTVRRFHANLVAGDETAVLREMADGERVSGRDLRAMVKFALGQGAKIQLGRVYTEGRLSYVDVVYVDDRNQVIGALRYVVKKDEYRWQIDAGETNALRRQMFDFS